MSDTNLSGYILEDIEFIDIDLSGADLTNTTLRNVKMKNINLINSIFINATLFNVQLTGSDLTGANLTGADLSDVDLSGVDLIGVNLTGVDLAGLDLTVVDFTGADLTGVDLTGVDLTGVDLTGSIFSETTKFSDGLIYLNTIDKFHVNKMRFKKAIDHRNDNITMKTDRDIININIRNILDSSYRKPKKIKLSNYNIESIEKRRNIFNTISSKREKELYRKFFYREMIEKMNERIQIKLNNLSDNNFKQNIKYIKGIPSDFGKENELSSRKKVVYVVPPLDITQDISVNLYDPEINELENVVTTDLEEGQSMLYYYINEDKNINLHVKLQKTNDTDYTLEKKSGVNTLETLTIINPSNTYLYNFDIVSENKRFKITFGSVNAENTQLKADVCFIGDTLIKTDQVGNIKIKHLDYTKHTIDGRKIEFVTKTIYDDKKIVCIRKGALGKNIPDRDTYVSKKHCVYLNNTLIEAYKLVEKYKKVKYVSYNGECLYNIVFKNYGIINIHNMYFETLDPENKIATAYRREMNHNKNIKILN